MEQKKRFELHSYSDMSMVSCGLFVLFPFCVSCCGWMERSRALTKGGSCGTEWKDDTPHTKIEPTNTVTLRDGWIISSPCHR